MEPAIEAARFGKHVICEKPLEISLNRIDKMIKAHAEAGTRLGGIFNYRFNDTLKYLKKAVDDGRFGTITYRLSSCAMVEKRSILYKQLAWYPGA